MNSIDDGTANRVSKLFIILLLTLILSPNAFAKEVIGWVENVHLLPGKVLIKAKMDTGAKSSSLHCDCVAEFIRDGERWVRFVITGIDGEPVTVEKKVVRTVKIKRHFGDVQQRDVVRMGICIGDQYEETDVSVIDRSGFNYSLLVGRTYLKDKFIVDPSQQFTVNPDCKGVK